MALRKNGRQIDPVFVREVFSGDGFSYKLSATGDGETGLSIVFPLAQ